MLEWPHVFSHHHTLPVLSLLNNIFSDAKRTWLYWKVKKKFAKRPNLPFHFRYLAKEMGYLCIKLILDLLHGLTQLWRSPPCSRVCFSSQSWTAKQTFKVWAAKLCQRLQARLPLVLFPPPAPSCALMWTCCFATHNHLVRNTLGTFFFFFCGEVICFDLQRVPDFQKYQIRTGLLESLPCLCFSFHSSAFR